MPAHAQERRRAGAAATAAAAAGDRLRDHHIAQQQPLRKGTPLRSAIPSPLLAWSMDFQHEPQGAIMRPVNSTGAVSLCFKWQQ